jgi:transcriptional regulator with XRE-family HTH domain
MSAPRKRQRVNYFDDPVLLGRRLRETREAAGLSQRELSFPGCTAAYISRIEKGERVPSLQLIREFAVRLGVSEAFIAYGTHAPALRTGDLEFAEVIGRYQSAIANARAPSGNFADAEEALGHALYELAIATFERLPTSYSEEAYAKFAALLEQRGDAATETRSLP